MSSVVKTTILWVVIIVFVFLLWSLFTTTKSNLESITYTAFLERVDAGTVERVTIRGNEVVGVTRPSGPGGRYEFHTMIPSNYPYTFDTLRAHGVNIELETEHDAPLLTALISWAPILFLIGLWVFFMRTIRRGQQQKAEQAPPPGNIAPPTA